MCGVGIPVWAWERTSTINSITTLLLKQGAYPLRSHNLDFGLYLDHGLKFLSQRWIFQAFNSYAFTLGLSVFAPNLTLGFMHSPTTFLLLCLKNQFESTEKRIVCQTIWLCFKTWDVVVLWLYGQKRTIFVKFNWFLMSLKYLTVTFKWKSLPC